MTPPSILTYDRNVNQYDIYHQWLGIPPAEQPPNLYRLLGVAKFEKDPEVIRNAAERQALHVRRLARGEFTDAGQELLNEIAAAKLELSNPVKRDRYDQTLRPSAIAPVAPAGRSAPEKPMAPVQENGGTDGDANGSALVQPPSTVEPAKDSTQDESPSDDPTSVLSEIEATTIDLSIRPGTGGDAPAWMIGYHRDCDVRVRGQTVSGFHCQATFEDGRLFLTDLKSTNGTFVNRSRLDSTTEIFASDLVTLGAHHRILFPAAMMAPGPYGSARVIFIGRGPGNEWRLEDPSVSLFHIRVALTANAVVAEDLKSKRGMQRLRPGQPPEFVSRCELLPGDRLQLGDSQIVAERLFRIRDRVL